MSGRKGHKETDYETEVDKISCLAFKQLKNLTAAERKVLFPDITSGLSDEMVNDVRRATVKKLKAAGRIK